MSTELTRPDQYAEVVRIVTDSLTSPHSRRAYGGALRRYLAWHTAGDWPRLSRASVQAYRAYLLAGGAGRGAVNLMLSAVRALAREAAAQGLLEEGIAAGILAVKGAGGAGRRTGNWLTAEAAQKLLNAPDAGTLIGKRDRLIMGLLLGCGLRREEAVRLQVEQLQERDGRPVLVDVLGKGAKLRTVPVPRWCRAAAEDWLQATALTSGPLLRPLKRAGGVGDGQLDPRSLYLRILVHARALGLGPLAPHDLRRTFARLALAGGAKLDQIQVSLGHANLVVTQRYLGTSVDLKDPACDHLGVSL